MRTGIIIYSDDPEAVWNAFRFGNFALAMEDEVKIFLLGKGVELELMEAEKFDIAGQLQTFVNSGGKVFVCGTCLEIHRLEPQEIYIVATMKDIYEIVKESDRVITF